MTRVLLSPNLAAKPTATSDSGSAKEASSARAAGDVGPNPTAWVDETWCRGYYGLRDALDATNISDFIGMLASRNCDPNVLFCAAFYKTRAAIGDVNSIEAFEHFVRFGFKNNINPHPLIDLKTLRDGLDRELTLDDLFVKNLADVPLQCNVHPAFDNLWYVEMYPDVAKAKVHPLYHYLRDGNREGRLPHLLFDPQYYRNQTGTSARRNTDFGDFIEEIGVADARPHPFVDLSWYREHHSDVPRDRAGAFIHLYRVGLKENRRPSVEFDPQFYTTTYPDIRNSGLGAFEHFCLHGHREKRLPRDQYIDWIDSFDSLSERDKNNMVDSIAALGRHPRISIVIPVYNTPLEFLERAINSVRNQLYWNWELCISDDASSDAAVVEYLRSIAKSDRRIQIVLRLSNGHISQNTNTALALATGEYICFMDADDELTVDALAWVALAANIHPNAKLLYSDEDKIDTVGTRMMPHFKSDWDVTLLRRQNYVCHLLVMKAELLDEIGWLNNEYVGAQDHELLLRASERCNRDEVVHIPIILYHWRVLPGSTSGGGGAKPYAQDAAVRAVKAHAKRTNMAATISANALGYVSVEPVPSQNYKVSVVIPTTMKHEVTRTLLRDLANTVYKHLEIVLIISSADFARDGIESELQGFGEKCDMKIVLHDVSPFSFSTVNNKAVKFCDGDYLVFLNDDIGLADRGWLSRLMARYNDPLVGIVGPRLLYPNRTVQHAGVYVGIGGVADHPFRFLGENEPSYFSRAAIEHEVSAVTGACLCIPKKLFDSCGGFEEGLPVAFQDVDLCLKISHQRKFKVLYVPGVTLLHHESISLGDHASADRRDQFLRECSFMIKKWDKVLSADPAYSPNLSLKSGHGFQLAWPPRIMRKHFGNYAQSLSWINIE